MRGRWHPWSLPVLHASGKATWATSHFIRRETGVGAAPSRLAQVALLAVHADGQPQQQNPARATWLPFILSASVSDACTEGGISSFGQESQFPHNARGLKLSLCTVMMSFVRISEWGQRVWCSGGILRGTLAPHATAKTPSRKPSGQSHRISHILPLA